MKRKILLFLVCVCAVSFSVFFLSACGWSGESNEDKNTEYTILYSDGKETHTLKVKDGDVYSIDAPLPEKQGYDFAGLYDSETGGKQYVTATGVSISAFTEKRSLTLYPQFTPIEYTLKLDYGEAFGTENSLSVKYDEKIPDLPGDLIVSDKSYMNFVGWFARTNYSEIQITEADGVSVMQLNQSITNLSDSEKVINLYAKFEKQKYTVTFYSFDGQKVLETLQIPHGDKISELTQTIKENGATVTEWATAPYAAYFKFDGEVTENMELFAINSKKSVSFTVENCADNNGYNPQTKASEADDRTRHNGFEVVRLSVENITVSEDGKFGLLNGKELQLNLLVMQNISKLPINNNEAQQKSIAVDTFNGRVYGTAITGKAINRGAYCVKINYVGFDDDESSTYKWDTDILNGKTKGDVIELNIVPDENKKIKNIEVTVVYEIYAGAPGVMGIWWNEHSDWRCTTVIEFN